MTSGSFRERRGIKARGGSFPSRHAPIASFRLGTSRYAMASNCYGCGRVGLLLECPRALLWAAALTIAAAVAAVLVVREAASSEPGPHMASSCDDYPYPVVCTQRIAGEFSYYGRRLAKGLCSHDDAHSGLGNLRNAFALARAHEAAPQRPGLRPFSLDTLGFQFAALCPNHARFFPFLSAPGG